MAGRLFAIDRKRDQGVARHPAPIAVAGVDIQHTVHNGRPRAVKRTALGRDAVGARIFLDGVVVLYDITGVGGIAAQMAINRPGKHHAGQG